MPTDPDGNGPPPKGPTKGPAPLPPEGMHPDVPVIQRPGYVPGGGFTRKDYDEWFVKNAAGIQPWFAANPGRETELRQILWEYGSVNNYDDGIDALLMRGFAVPGSGGGGGGRGGGGGGGGASKEQQYAAAEAAIRNQSRQLGLLLEEDGIKALAKTVVDSNWSNDQLMDHLVPQAQATTNPGSILATVDQIRKMAGNQLLTVSDATAREWAARIASNEMTLEAVNGLLATKATEKYGWAASQIGQGVSVRDMLLPTRDLIARELELNPEEVDLMDSKWLGMVQTADPKDGTIRAATDSEVVIRARKDPTWKNTRSAAVTASNTAMRLREYLGA